MSEPFLAILQVATTFHRPIGDVGNYDTWKIPVKIRVVTETADNDVVRESTNYSDAFIEAWVNVALEMVEEGAVAIITSCGFLATLHPTLQARIPVPVGTSSLMQIPWAQSIIPKDKKIGILTFDASNLTPLHLKSVGVDYDVPIAGVREGGTFHKVLRTGIKFDYKGIEADVIEAADRLIKENPDIGGFLLECTNMPPYKGALLEKFKLPIWDINTLGNYLYSVALPQKY